MQMMHCFKAGFMASSLAIAMPAAAYEIQAIDPEYIGFGGFDLEAGKVIWADFSDSWEVNFFDGQAITQLSNDANSKSATGISSGTIFWAEAFRSNPAELMMYQDGLLTAITQTGREKASFTYDTGQAAWFERVAGVFELFFYNGSQVQQVTSGGNFFPATSNSAFLQLDQGEIVFQAFADGVNSIFYWDGDSVNQVSPEGVNASLPDVENGVVVWIGLDASENQQVFKLVAGETAQLTFDIDGLSKTDTQIEDGIISWEVLTDSTATNSELWVIRNGETQKLTSSMANGRAQFDSGKVIWTEGEGGVASRIVENMNNETVVVHVGENPIGLKADGGFLVWREGLYPNSPAILLASPSDDVEPPADSVNAGPEHSSTLVTVDGSLTIMASDWNAVNWTPSSLKFGITTTDGSPLNGVTVIDENGDVIALSDWWSVVSQVFNGEARYITIETTQARELSVQWWTE